MQHLICKVCSHRHAFRDPHIFKPPPKYTKAKRVEGLCVRCGKRPAVHSHHVVHKGVGGRKGLEKLASDDASNRENLCGICHAALHGIGQT